MLRLKKPPTGLRNLPMMAGKSKRKYRSDFDGGARNPKVPTLFQVADVDTGVINWINADLMTHICPRV